MSIDTEQEGAGHNPAFHGGPQRRPTAIERALDALTRALALAGGALLIVAIGITVVSVAGRYLFSTPVPGDYELVELICGIGIFLFFPYTHAADGNIIAEFFTTGLSPRRRRALDVGNDIIFTLVAMLLTWRLGVGFLDKYSSGEATILIQIPLWWGYGVAVLSMFLLTIVCLMRVAVGLEALRR